MQFRVEVIADSSGKWCGNQLVFATRKEAEEYAVDLASRWTLVREWRVVQTEEPANRGEARPGSASATDETVVTVTLGPLTRVYRALCTTAPSAYDAGTSITLVTGSAGSIEGLLSAGVLSINKQLPARLVLVEAKLFEWHRGRYTSGLYASVEPDPELFGTPQVAAELLSRLARGTPTEI